MGKDNDCFARLQVRVQPKSRRNEILVVGEGRLRVYVTAPPEGGKANQAVVSLLADRLCVPKGRIQVLRGHRVRDKVLLVEGLDVHAVMARLGSKAPRTGPYE